MRHRQLVRVGLVSFFATLLVSHASPVHAVDFFEDIEGYRFIIPKVSAKCGQTIRFAIQGAHEQSAQGFQMGVRYPSEDLTIHRIDATDTILESIDTDFIDVNINPDEGFFTVGVIVDATPPFDGDLIPNIMRPLTLLYVDATVGDHVERDLTLRFEDGLGIPPIANLYTVDNHSEFLTQHDEGVINIRRHPRLAMYFIRGDANTDYAMDISDVIVVLRHQFEGNGADRVLCLDAADANDDGSLDISDAIFVLLHLFAEQGSPPSRPYPRPGEDWTPDGLDCFQPLYWRYL